MAGRLTASRWLDRLGVVPGGAVSRLHALAMVLMTSMALAAQAREPFSVPLECQLESGGWHPCTMTVERIGEHWWLQVGQRRFDFRHDGQGRIELKEASGPPREVSPSWTREQALCWDRVCTKGNLPLD